MIFFWIKKDNNFQSQYKANIDIDIELFGFLSSFSYFMFVTWINIINFWRIWFKIAHTHIYMNTIKLDDKNNLLFFRIHCIVVVVVVVVVVHCSVVQSTTKYINTCIRLLWIHSLDGFNPKVVLFIEYLCNYIYIVILSDTSNQIRQSNRTVRQLLVTGEKKK